MYFSIDMLTALASRLGKRNNLTSLCGLKMNSMSVVWMYIQYKMLLTRDRLGQSVATATAASGSQNTPKRFDQHSYVQQLIPDDFILVL